MRQYCIRQTPREGQNILMKIQLILTWKQAVSQALPNREIVLDFAQVPASYLNRYRFYFEALSGLTHVQVEMPKSGNLNGAMVAYVEQP